MPLDAVKTVLQVGAAGFSFLNYTSYRLQVQHGFSGPKSCLVKDSFLFDPLSRPKQEKKDA